VPASGPTPNNLRLTGICDYTGVTLVVVVLLVSLALGRALGGRVRRLARVSFRSSVLLVVAIVAQVALASATGRAAMAVLVVSQLAPIWFVWANRGLPGMGLVTVGFVLNAAVILANGAMPVGRSALEAIGGRYAPAGRHRLLQDGDALPFLADVVPLPPLGIVVSAGDVVLAAGVGVLVVALMRGLPAEPVEGRGQPVAH
jgi:hypothetical protein